MKKTNSLLIILLLGLSSLLLVIYLRDFNPLLAAALIFISVMGLLHARKKTITIIYPIAAILGAASEITAVHYGVWNYANPTFFGIPVWLPFLWGNAAIFILTLSMEIE